MILEHWAPKIIGYVDNPNHKKIDIKLIKVCNNLQKKIKKGGDHWISNKTYNTLDNYNIHKDKNFKTLYDWIFQCVIEYANKLKYKPDFKCVGSWFNVYKKNDYQEFHTHSMSSLSAVYFLKSDPEKSSKIYFRVREDDTLSDPVITYLDSINYPLVWYKAVPGRLLIFKSSLPHSVAMSNEDDTRISLAFNFNNK
jgi:uncharacterized protein (TIGR02466 family)